MPRIRSGALEVDGLKELARDLRNLDKDLVRELRGENKKAADIVSADARSTAQSLGGVAAHVAPSIRSSAGATSAGVALGGDDYPMAMGAEFGGGRRPTTQQFKPWRGSGPSAGYFVYPSIGRNIDQIEENYGDMLENLITKAGLTK